MLGPGVVMKGATPPWGATNNDLTDVEVFNRSTVASVAGNGSKTEQKEKIKTVVATDDQINRAPVGNSNHRIWKCQAEPLQGARAKWSRKVDRKKEASCDVAGHPAWERGLVPKPSPRKTAIAATDMGCQTRGYYFRWRNLP